MRLEALLSVVDENTAVLLWNADGRYLAEYNGKDSIDKKYNSWLVIKISDAEIVDAIDVVIKEV